MVKPATSHQNALLQSRVWYFMRLTAAVLSAFYWFHRQKVPDLKTQLWFTNTHSYLTRRHAYIQVKNGWLLDKTSKAGLQFNKYLWTQLQNKNLKFSVFDQTIVLNWRPAVQWSFPLWWVSVLLFLISILYKIALWDQSKITGFEVERKVERTVIKTSQVFRFRKKWYFCWKHHHLLILHSQSSPISQESEPLPHVRINPSTPHAWHLYAFLLQGQPVVNLVNALPTIVNCD